jgi:hypothetical protein
VYNYIPFLSCNVRFKNIPLDNQRTSVCNRGNLNLAPFSSHNILNNLEFSTIPQTRLITLTTKQKNSLLFGTCVFRAKGYLWNTKGIKVALRTNCFMWTSNPEWIPVNDSALLIYICQLIFFHCTPLSKNKIWKILNISPRAVMVNYWENMVSFYYNYLLCKNRTEVVVHSRRHIKILPAVVESRDQHYICETTS